MDGDQVGELGRKREEAVAAAPVKRMTYAQRMLLEAEANATEPVQPAAPAKPQTSEALSPIADVPGVPSPEDAQIAAPADAEPPAPQDTPSPNLEAPDSAAPEDEPPPAAPFKRVADAGDVEALYLLLLRRQAENETVVQNLCGLSLTEAARGFITSEEFILGTVPICLGESAGPSFDRRLLAKTARKFGRLLQRHDLTKSEHDFVGVKGWSLALYSLFRDIEIRALLFGRLGGKAGLLMSALARTCGLPEESERASGPALALSMTPPSALREGSDALAAGADKSPWRGAVTQVNQFGVKGWTASVAASAARPLLAAAFGDVVIACEGHDPGQPSPIEEAGTRVAFNIPLDAPETAQRMRGAVYGALAECARNGENPRDRAVELSVILAPPGPDETESLRLPPSGCDTLFSLLDWCDLLDIDADAAELGPQPSLLGVTPDNGAAVGVARAIAFYLPQYHPFPENDEWWGRGFTEWNGVSTAPKLFDTHASPNLPADLGFYDIRLKEVRKQQGELAKLYGLYGFCYYYYWFSGRKLMQAPLELMLRDGEPNLPFCLCWANESWSRRWDGSESDVLMGQKHDVETDLRIFDDLLPFFSDPRYIRIDGKPVFIVYRLTLMDDPEGFVRGLRQRAAEHGLPGLTICSVMSFGITDPRPYGCDYAVEFPPHGLVAGEIDPKKVDADPTYSGKIYDYAAAAESSVLSTHDFPLFPGVMPRWDNTARKKEKGNIFHKSSPLAFEAWMRHAARQTVTRNPEAPLLFINSWNEWGEGAQLEPDRTFGRGYLDAARRALAGIAPEAHDAPLEGADALYATLRDPDQAQRLELRFLANRLARIDELVRPPEVITGFPKLCAGGAHTPGRAGYFDVVTGRIGQNLLAVRQAQSLQARGWCVGAHSGKPGYLYLLFQAVDGGASFHTPVSRRAHREDIQQALELAISNMAGFDLNIACAGLPRGVYKISLIEAVEQTSYHLDLGYMLQVE